MDWVITLDELEVLWVLDMAGVFLALRLIGEDLAPKLLGLPAFLYALPLLELTLFELSGWSSLGTSLSLVSVMDKLLIMFLMGVSLESFES